jgi:hypothetical protein
MALLKRRWAEAELRLILAKQSERRLAVNWAFCYCRGGLAWRRNKRRSTNWKCDRNYKRKLKSLLDVSSQEALIFLTRKSSAAAFF